MKKLKSLKEATILNRSKQKRIFGGSEQMMSLDGEAKCSNTGCENKHSGDICYIDNKKGTCSLGSCAQTNQLLCYV